MTHPRNQHRWDKYFHSVCEAVASNSRCLSRQIGAILVRDSSIVATGYNGPPRGIPHCKVCQRKELGFSSGEGLHLCPAAHAEANCIVNAARLGVSTLGATLFMNCCIPCRECLKLLINSGVKEIVVNELVEYDNHSNLLITKGQFWIREFDLRL